MLNIYFGTTPAATENYLSGERPEKRKRERGREMAWNLARGRLVRRSITKPKPWPTSMHWDRVHNVTVLSDKWLDVCVCVWIWEGEGRGCGGVPGAGMAGTMNTASFSLLFFTNE